jgi:hypothetical protein
VNVWIFADIFRQLSAQNIRLFLENQQSARCNSRNLIAAESVSEIPNIDIDDAFLPDK